MLDVAFTQLSTPMVPAVTSLQSTLPQRARSIPAGWLFGDATSAREESDTGTSDCGRLRLRVETVDGWQRWAHRALPSFVTVMCASGFAVVGSGVPLDAAGLSREPVRTSLIPIHDTLLHGSPWTRAEIEQVLTRSGSVEMLAPTHEAQARIRHLGSLGAGWDGTDVSAPNPDAIRDAMTLIAKLASAGAFLRPRIGLESDGTVGFSFFRDGRAIADMTIPGDATYSYFAQDDGKPSSRDDASIGSSIPSDLLAILAA